MELQRLPPKLRSETLGLNLINVIERQLMYVEDKVI
jgi:hypothetical protein